MNHFSDFLKPVVGLRHVATRFSSLGRILLLFLFSVATYEAEAQEVLSLEKCRELALQNNKQLLIGQERITAAGYTHKAARTNYLPRFSAEGSYLLTSREISLLNNNQKSALNHLGTNLATPLSQAIGSIAEKYPELAQSLSVLGQDAVKALDGAGSDLRKAFRTNTHNVWAGALTLTQPVYLGGKIRAYDRITGYAENLSRQKLRTAEQEVILSTDEAYWLVVSLRGKKSLAESYLNLLKTLDGDVQKMIREGVATRADGLTVSVKLNEAEMTLLKVDDGLSLARMALWQLCGLPLESSDQLADEQEGATLKSKTLVSAPASTFSLDTTYANRPELQSLETAVQMYGEKVKIARSEFLPSIAALGSFVVTNPSLYNGFENKFRGNWAVGLSLKVPIFSWFEGRYKVRAARAEQSIANYELQEAREKIALQVNQSAFRVKEAWKKYQMTLKNCEKADENLRTAQVGFREGVIPASNLLEAQTAWINAKTEKIDAEIDVKLTEIYLQKAQGTLQ